MAAAPTPPTAVLTVESAEIVPEAEAGLYCVRGTWTGTADRRGTTGFIVRGLPLARRLQQAIAAGAVFADPQVATDIHGNTYVTSRSLILSRRANADLRRLGF